MDIDDEAVDIVFTWVDDSFPGYKEELQRFASDQRDGNPNRTRDNLELIRFGLRSIARNARFFRRIYILTCRPQIPTWLDISNPAIRVVHHDEIMDAGILPTYNSFAIVSHLHLMPDVAGRFVYFEDDMLVARPLGVADLLAPDGRPYVFTRPVRTIAKDRLNRTKASPWNLALASADQALSQHFGRRVRHHIIHGPRLIYRDSFAAMIDRFSDQFAVTRKSRFRAAGNVPPEYLYPHYLLETGAGVAAAPKRSRDMEGYSSLENFTPWTWLQLKMLEARRPQTITLNDSFGHSPRPAAVQLAKSKLEQWFPDPSPFERNTAV